MATDIPSVLPPNASPQERALELTHAERFAAIPVPVRDVKNPDACPPELLPWLAWEFGVDTWNTDWTEQEKRNAIKRAAYIHRHRGTPAAVKMSLEDSPFTTEIREWFEQEPKADPYTFMLDVVQDGRPVTQPDLQDLKNAVMRAKNLRSWFSITMQGKTRGNMILAGWMRAAESVLLMPGMTLTGVGVNDWLTSDFSPSTSFSGAVYSLVIQGAMGPLNYQVTTENATVNGAGDVTITGPGTVTVTATDGYGRTLEHSISPTRWVVQDGTMALPGEAFDAWLAGMGARIPEGDELAEHFGTGGARGMGSLSQEWGDLSAFGWNVNEGTSRADLYITGTAEGSEGTHIIAVYLWGNNWGIQSSWPLELNTPLACCGIIDVLPAGLTSEE
ncbi:phage tail protein I [Cedecea lapagei]|nr:phage tail protein I [Cedecea lapagei]